MSDRLVTGIVLGIAATMLMDVWNVLLRGAFGIPSLDYCLLGRWVRHMPATFRHASIARAASRPNECATGWTAHYSIGAALGVAFVLIASGSWLARPTLLPALAFGLVTVALPFFLLQPALGLGVASSNAPAPARARLKSVGTHAVFGCGLFLAGLALAAMQP